MKQSSQVVRVCICRNHVFQSVRLAAYLFAKELDPEVLTRWVRNHAAGKIPKVLVFLLLHIPFGQLQGTELGHSRGQILILTVAGLLCIGRLGFLVLLLVLLLFVIVLLGFSFFVLLFVILSCCRTMSQAILETTALSTFI